MKHKIQAGTRVAYARRFPYDYPPLPTMRGVVTQVQIHRGLPTIAIVSWDEGMATGEYRNDLILEEEAND